MNARYGILAAVVAVCVIALAVLASSLYTVSMTEWVVITQFGRPVPGSEKIGPGLHFKTPFVQTVNRIEKRLISWDGDPNRIPTRDKKYIHVNTYARWRVSDPLSFFTRLQGRLDNGQKKLDDVVDSVVRDVVGKHNLIEVVRSTDRPLQYESDELAAEQADRAEKVTAGRLKMMQDITEKARERLPVELGIEVVDVRVKRVSYVESVRDSIYGRMQSERNRIATRYLSEAEEEANEIKGGTNKQLATIIGETEEQAAAIKGEADAEAIKIYGDAIAQTKDFYEFLRALEAYKASIDPNTTLVLSTESDFLRFLKRLDKAPAE